MTSAFEPTALFRLPMQGLPVLKTSANAPSGETSKTLAPMRFDAGIPVIWYILDLRI